MKCYNCPFYEGGQTWNSCGVIGAEYFSTLDNCTLVNDDGTINMDDEYFKQE